LWVPQGPERCPSRERILLPSLLMRALVTTSLVVLTVSAACQEIRDATNGSTIAAENEARSQREDVESWRGVPVIQLETHPLFLPIRSAARFTANVRVVRCSKRAVSANSECATKLSRASGRLATASPAARCARAVADAGPAWAALSRRMP
jgi:hypothetical protein